MMQPLSSLNQAYRPVLLEERQRECQNTTSLKPDSAAFISSYQRFTNNQMMNNSSNKGNVFPKQNNSQQNGGNNSQNQQVVYGLTPSGKRSKYFRDHCKIFGHSIESCFKIHGPPPNRQNFSNKRIAGNAQFDEPESQMMFYNTMPMGSQHVAETSISFAINDGSGNSHSLTSDQYEQLLMLLQNHKVDSNATRGTKDHANAFSLKSYLMLGLSIVELWTTLHLTWSYSLHILLYLVPPILPCLMVSRLQFITQDLKVRDSKVLGRAVGGLYFVDAIPHTTA